MTKQTDEVEILAGTADLRALLENGAGYRMAVESVHDYAIFAMDPEGRVASWNPGAENLLGYGKEEIFGRDATILFTPEDRQRGVPQQELRTAAEKGRTSDDRWHMRKDGTSFFASGITTGLRDPQGTLQGFIKIMRDRTDRKRLEEELQNRAEALARADREKDEFLAVLAHELRNPLAPVFYALRLLDEKPLEDPQRWYLRRIVDRQMRRLARLIDDLLDISRIRTGKVELRKERLELSNAVSHAVDIVRPLCDDRGILLTVDLPAEPVWLEADATRLEQVLSNLLSNAVKFTQDKGSISVTAERETREIVLRVKDTGVGIAPDLLPRIFDLFIQGDRSLDRARDGLGIGLTLSQKLVELHGGTIEAHSSGVGTGSEFVIRLPVLLETARPEAEPARVAGSPSHSLRILVVDDSEDTAETMGTLLEMSGHTVQIAHNGPSALEAAVTFLPDVILLDIGLPGLDGYQVAERLRENPAMRNVTLIAASGYGQEEDRRRSMAAGIDRHLVKPVDLKELQDLLAAVGERRGAGE